MKYSVLVSAFNPENGISIVSITCKYGKFTGKAQLNPEDKPYESKYFGCQIAEMRALIEVYKSRIGTINEQLKSLSDTFYIMDNSKKTNKKSAEMGITRKQINVYLNSKIKLYDKMMKLKISIENLAQQRIKMLKKVEEKRKGNNR